jgi:hypothetical protein
MAGRDNVRRLVIAGCDPIGAKIATASADTPAFSASVHANVA